MTPTNKNHNGKEKRPHRSNERPGDRKFPDNKGNRGSSGRNIERRERDKPDFRKDKRGVHKSEESDTAGSRQRKERTGAVRGKYISDKEGNRPERSRRSDVSGKREKHTRGFDVKRSAASSKGNKTGKSDEQGPIRLNRYIARSGICSRREADELIIAGEVKVNGVIVTELGTKVTHADTIHVGDQLMRFEKPVYLLLNKPKGYITTTDDPFKRKTVMALVQNACKENIFPVGRLDRNTTGLLLFTNDGDMAKKLTHPSGNIRKIYHVYLNKALTKGDMLKIAEGLELEDGLIRVDAIAYVGAGADKKDIGVELHSGKNRIIRRIFESLGYEVVKLDRVVFANLTKKDLKRGHHRFLTPQEVSFLKML